MASMEVGSGDNLILSAEEVRKLKKSRAGNAGYLTRLYGEMKEVMKGYDRLEEAQKHKTQLDEAFEKFKASHIKYSQYVKDEEDQAELKYSYQAREIEYREFCDLYENWLYHMMDHKGGEKKASPPASIISRSSSKSHENELAKLEIENKIKQLQIEKEILNAEYQLQKANLESEKDEMNNSCSNFPVKVNNIDLANSLKELTTMITLPRYEMTAFDGNPQNYVKFIKEFELQIESKTNDPKQRLGFLMHYCKGDALKEIEVCKVMGSTKGYEKAKELLAKRFGEPYIIARAFLDCVCKGPVLKNNDRKGLADFALKMRNCYITLSELGYLADLNSNMALISIVERLPYSLKAKWMTVVGQYREKQEEVQFKHLLSFVEQRAKSANDPVFGSLLDQAVIKRPIGKEVFVKGTSFYAESSNKGKVENTKGFSGKCFYCNGQHGVTSCNEFKRQTYETRRNAAMKKRLCFNCLIPNHTSAKCQKEKQCKVDQCSDTRKHHTLLHEGQKAQNASPQVEAETFAEVRIQAGHSRGVYFQVLPVRIKGQDNTWIKTYALLDGASDICICTNKILSRLGIDAKEEKVSIRTLGNTKSHLAKGVKLSVAPVDGEDEINLPLVWGMDGINIPGKRIPLQEDISQYEHLRDIAIPSVEEKEIGLLIGANIPEVFICKEYRIGRRGEPVGFKGVLGWTVMGGNKQNTITYGVNLIDSSISRNETLSAQLEKFWTLDSLAAGYSDSKMLSLEDRRALNIMENSTTLGKDGHYKIRLPWKYEESNLPNNRTMVEERLNYLKKRLQRNPELAKKYKEVIENYLDKGYAREIPQDEVKNPKGQPVWYLPHHPVTNPQKPGKVRVVFDCAATFGGKSLNSELLSGPDLTNNLVGVLLRFREEPVAILGDIESMFNQVKVYAEDYDALRFLWWENSDIYQGKVVEYQMCVHLFGATSSPSCSSFALKKTALDHQSEFPVQIVEAINKNFYVDDFLQSVPTDEMAVECIERVSELLKLGGFHITKWTSNSKRVLSSVPEIDRSKLVANLDLQNETLPTERALGVWWNTETDSFEFTHAHKEHSFTRRGILSVMSSIYDPLGFLSPVILKAKLLMQTLVRKGIFWDEQIPTDYLDIWIAWLDDLKNLRALNIPRCVLRPELGEPIQRDLHHFCDASERAYGCISYLRQKFENGEVICSLIFSKSRLAPLKTQSIPRLELQAAVTAVRVSKFLVGELSNLNKIFFWTDSTSVLQFIQNESRRFKVFVGNRVAEIRDSSEAHQWYYVNTKENPADIVSRGENVSSLSKKDEWLQGPEFLRMPDATFTSRMSNVPSLPEDHEEIKRESEINAVITEDDHLKRFIEYFSSLYKLKIATAWLSRFKEYMLTKYRQRAHRFPLRISKLTVVELTFSERELVAYEQRNNFSKEISSLLKNERVSKSSNLLALNPFLDNGILKVGGRLDHSGLSDQAKHPAILPAKSHLSKLVILDAHKSSGHTGRNHVLCLVRSKYWILRGKAAVRRILSECLICRRWNQPLGQQQMASLPESRTVGNEPVFSRVGVDFFGPICVKIGRSSVKRYGCIFTCLATRAVHLEVAHQLDSDSFINAFRRFINRRGKPIQVYSDNGTNFVGAEKIMKSELEKWNLKKVESYCKQKSIEWFFNPPLASHMGGVWERLIKQVKKFLYIIIGRQTLTEENLSTFMTEVEFIMNSRPLTECSNDASDLEPLTPNHLLLLKPHGNVSPGIFDSNDSITRKRWKQVQYLADCFWKRWLSEYLACMQVRQKWLTKKQNFKVGDLVLVEGNSHRGQWPLGRVMDIFPGPDGLVRHVRLKMRDGVVIRPIVKLCLLEECL